jgi:hypothetical protein
MRHQIIVLGWLMLFAFGSSTVMSQQKEAGNPNRDLSNMFYTDTLPPKPEPVKATPTPVKKATPVKKPVLRKVGMKYRLWHLTADANCENIDVQEVPPASTFHSGDRIRLLFESNVDGYLYVMQKGSTGRDHLLFPNPQLGGDNRIVRGMQYPVPAKRWFTFDKNPGEEHLTVVVSRTPLKSLPQQVTPQNEGSVSVVSVVEELNQSVKPRDLVMFQEKGSTPAGTAVVPDQSISAPVTQATIVINTSEANNNAAYVEIRLKHE